MQVKRLLNNEPKELSGKYFSATEKAFLRIENQNKNIPIVIGSWNEKMAKIAGELADELQIANVWNSEYLHKLYSNLTIGTFKKFSIGGMSCISYNKEEAYNTAKNTVAVYIPYLVSLLENQGFDTNSEYFKELFRYSKLGQYDKCADLLTNEIIDCISLVGTPEMVSEKIEKLLDEFDIEGIMISPPYGTGTFEDNLELIAEKIVHVVSI